MTLSYTRKGCSQIFGAITSVCNDIVMLSPACLRQAGKSTTIDQRTETFSAFDFPVLRSCPISKLTLSPSRREPPRCKADT